MPAGYSRIELELGLSRPVGREDSIRHRVFAPHATAFGAVDSNCGTVGAAVDDVVLVSYEAVANGIEHAYRGASGRRITQRQVHG